MITSAASSTSAAMVRNTSTATMIASSQRMKRALRIPVAVESIVGAQRKRTIRRRAPVRDRGAPRLTMRRYSERKIHRGVTGTQAEQGTKRMSRDRKPEPAVELPEWCDVELL